MPGARLVAAVAILSPLLAPLGTPGLMNPDEGRYVEIGREMAATGDWLVPRLHGIPHWAKPPLSYWAIGSSLRLFGVHERAARLPSAVAASLALLAIFVLSRGMGGTGLAVLVLASMLLFHALGRFATADMIQTCCITWGATLLWLGRGRRAAPFPNEGGPSPGRRLAYRLGAFACLGISFVDKGPVALGVTFAALLLWWILRPAAPVLSWRELLPGLAITLAIGLPWFLVVSRLHPDLFDFFLKGEVRDRYLNPETHKRSQPFWYFPVILIAGTLPWTPLFLASIGRMAAGIARSGRRNPDADATRFIIAWIAGPFLLFQLSGSKLATYLLPLMPFCALAVARWVEGLIAGEPPAPRRGVRGFLTALVLMPAAVAVAAAIYAIKKLGAPTAGWVTAAVVAGAAGLVMAAALRGRSPLRAGQAVLGVAILQLAWAWSAATMLGHDAVRFGSHDSQTWVREALGDAAARGFPIPTSLRPADPPAAAPPPTFATYDVKTNTLPFYLLGLRPEAFHDFDNPEGWEIASDKAMAKTPSLAQLVGILQGPGTVHVLTNRSDVPAVEAAFGRPLREVAARSDGKRSLVLLSNR
jgi:4-amino-4-deoxy-L-arabinose transferase-like glycosyltransferase